MTKAIALPEEKVTKDLNSETESGVSEKSTKTCSVKLVDCIGPKSVNNVSAADSEPSSVKTNATGEPLKRDLPAEKGQASSNSASEVDEPNAKKSRSSLPEHRVLLKPKDFVDLKRRTVSGFKPSEDKNSDTVKPIDSSTFDNVEEELGRMFGSSSPSKKDSSKVTISPVKSSGGGVTKDSSASQQNSSPTTESSNNSVSPPSSSGSGSVTITKLSTGSSLSVESKDLKSVLSGRPPQSSTSKTAASTNSENNGLRLKGNIDITAISSSSGSSLSNGPMLKQQHSPTGEGGSIRCNKCNVEYSTKEARRLHTCNSILDQHYLSVESAAERANSKSSSPNSPTAPTPAANPAASATENNSTSSPSSFDSTSSRSNSPMMDQWNNSKKSVKLIKEKSNDKLIIEGRPKLSVTKVSKMDNETKVKSGQSSPSLPKFKLSTMQESKKSNQDSDKKTATAARWSTLESSTNNVTSYSGKLKIKVGGSAGNGTTQDKSEAPQGPEGGLAFSFAGKPTYSPSRIEPSTASGSTVQTKGNFSWFFLGT